MTDHFKRDECYGCDEPIIWATDSHGNFLAIDFDPKPNGTYRLVDRSGGRVPTAVPAILGLPNTQLYRAHADSCTDAWVYADAG